MCFEWFLDRDLVMKAQYVLDDVDLESVAILRYDILKWVILW